LYSRPYVKILSAILWVLCAFVVSILFDSFTAGNRIAEKDLLIGAVAAAAVAAVAAALEVAGAEDHRAVFELVIFPFNQHAFE
jgi:hypothetical protein